MKQFSEFSNFRCTGRMVNSARIYVHQLIDMDSKKIPRILSIQSHVVCGYVGNKSATFPLQVNDAPALLNQKTL